MFEEDTFDNDIDDDSDTCEAEKQTIEDELKTLEATPGFMEGRLRTSANSDDRARHGEILKKRRELVARQLVKPPVDDDGMSQEQVKKELEEIESIEDFVNGRMRVSADPLDRERHFELLERRKNLIARLLLDESPVEVKALHEQSSRLDQAKQDVNELVEFHGYQKVRIPRNITEKDVIGLRLQVLCARNDFDGFSRFALSVQKRANLTAEQVGAMTSVAKMDISTSKKGNLLDELLRAIFEKD